MNGDAKRIKEGCLCSTIKYQRRLALRFLHRSAVGYGRQEPRQDLLEPVQPSLSGGSSEHDLAPTSAQDRRADEAAGLRPATSWGSKGGRRASTASARSPLFMAGEFGVPERLQGVTLALLPGPIRWAHADLVLEHLDEVVDQAQHPQDAFGGREVIHAESGKPRSGRQPGSQDRDPRTGARWANFDRHRPELLLRPSGVQPPPRKPRTRPSHPKVKPAYGSARFRFHRPRFS